MRKSCPAAYKICMILHSFRERDTEDRHCLAEDLCDCLNKNKTILEKLLILLAEDWSVVVVLVELLCKLVRIVCHECW